MSLAFTIAKDLILPEIIKALRRDDVPVNNSQATQIADKVANQVAPVIVNQTNSEPWYRSNVTWGALVAVAGGILQLYGWTISADDQAAIVDLIGQGVAFFGALWALYGRWVAKKPIGQ